MQFWLYNLGWLFLRPMIPWLLARRTASGKPPYAERYGKGAGDTAPGMIWLCRQRWRNCCRTGIGRSTGGA